MYVVTSTWWLLQELAGRRRARRRGGSEARREVGERSGLGVRPGGDDSSRSRSFLCLSGTTTESSGRPLRCIPVPLWILEHAPHTPTTSSRKQRDVLVRPSVRLDGRVVRDGRKGLRRVVLGRDGARLARRDREALELDVLALGLGLLLLLGVRLDAVEEVCRRGAGACSGVSDKVSRQGTAWERARRSAPSRHLECLTCSMRRLTRFSR